MADAARDGPTGGAELSGHGDGDLDSRAKIHDAVVRFYREVVFDDLLAPSFEEVAEVDWAEHLPKLVDYWCRVLLGDPAYDGYLLGPHRTIHEMSPFAPEHFTRWYRLWVDGIDQRWSGSLADAAKQHAARIGGVLSRQLTGDSWTPPT